MEKLRRRPPGPALELFIDLHWIDPGCTGQDREVCRRLGFEVWPTAGIFVPLSLPGLPRRLAATKSHKDFAGSGYRTRRGPKNALRKLNFVSVDSTQPTPLDPGLK